jgi:ParB-like chromosome segregation protein Spo0J
MTTTPKYEVHPLAQIFPEIEGSAFEALVEDIKERRQQEPAWLYEGKILDGKNRYRACEQLGVELKVREFIGSDPVGFVLSANLHRRHLDESQRAMVAGRLANLELGANQHSKGQGTSIEVAAKLLNVGRASVERAKKVLALGTPEQIQSVDKVSSLSLLLRTK